MSGTATVANARRIVPHPLVLGTLSGLTQTGAVVVRRTASRPPRSACDVRPGPDSYSWPVRPFDSPHPVRGSFGDPRTILVSSSLPTAGSVSFHNGVDISARPGAPVYPVVSGVVRRVSPDEIVVGAPRRRTFQYFHLKPVARVGETVWSQRTVIGLVHTPYRHVHLSELDGDTVQNPLAPGHLMPYRDRTVPLVRGIGFRNAHGEPLSPGALAGAVDVFTWAQDRPALRPPGAWRNVPTAPAAVSWELRRPSGRVVVPEQVAVAFSHTEPSNRGFWDVYRPGSYQNFPVVGRRHLTGLPGRYLFDLTPDLLDTARLATGGYLLTVRAQDTCGNVGTMTVRVRVLRQRHGTSGPRYPRVTQAGIPGWPGVLSFARWPQPPRRWTVALALVRSDVGLDGSLGRLRDAEAAGIADVGLLPSSVARSIEPGFDVVFAGSYRTRDAAARAALSAPVLTNFPNAAPLLVSSVLRSGPSRPHRPRGLGSARTGTRP